MRSDGIRDFLLMELGKRRLQRDIGIRIDRIILLEVGLIEPRELLLHIHIAVQDDVGIGRMIVAGMERTELVEA